MQLADFKNVEKLATRIGARFLNKYEPCVTLSTNFLTFSLFTGVCAISGRFS